MNVTLAEDSRSGAERPPWIDSGQVPCLDGLRAVAISMVFYSHMAPSMLDRGRSRLDSQIGDLGVDVFFVISGFLISLLLIREVSRTGRISLGDFYRRRALRILPAYMAFLAFAFTLSLLTGPTIPWLEWVSALTYLTNFMPLSPTIHNIGHSWSLSVEEHFYLV